jgi:pyruvate-formate lyase-activating enzyme
MEGYIANVTTSFIEIPGAICSAIYMTGCIFNCPSCQNKELQKLTYGHKMTVDDVVNILHENELAKWVCFLGGEPFYQPEFLYNICCKTIKPVGIYTGNDYNGLISNPLYTDIINLPNVLYLKTGRFAEELLMQNEYPITKNQEVRLKQDGTWTLIKSRTVNDVSKSVESVTFNHI